MYVCMYVCMYIRMYVCVCMYVRTYVCMYVYIHSLYVYIIVFDSPTHQYTEYIYYILYEYIFILVQYWKPSAMPRPSTTIILVDLANTFN